jgi:hypothetical protein
VKYVSVNAVKAMEAGMIEGAAPDQVQALRDIAMTVPNLTPQPPPREQQPTGKATAKRQLEMDDTDDGDQKRAAKKKPPPTQAAAKKKPPARREHPPSSQSPPTRMQTRNKNVLPTRAKYPILGAPGTAPPPPPSPQQSPPTPEARIVDNGKDEDYVPGDDPPEEELVAKKVDEPTPGVKPVARAKISRKKPALYKDGTPKDVDHASTQGWKDLPTRQKLLKCPHCDCAKAIPKESPGYKTFKVSPQSTGHLIVDCTLVDPKLKELQL